MNELEDIQKIHSLKIPSFDPPAPLFALSCLRAPSLSKVRLFRLELSFSPSIYILLKFRENKLIVSTSIFGWTQHVF